MTNNELTNKAFKLKLGKHCIDKSEVNNNIEPHPVFIVFLYFGFCELIIRTAYH